MEYKEQYTRAPGSGEGYTCAKHTYRAIHLYTRTHAHTRAVPFALRRHPLIPAPLMLPTLRRGIGHRPRRMPPSGLLPSFPLSRGPRNVPRALPFRFERKSSVMLVSSDVLTYRRALAPPPYGNCCAAVDWSRKAFCLVFWKSYVEVLILFGPLQTLRVAGQGAS